MIQIIEYKGYEVLVFAWLPPGQNGFKATYTFRVVEDNGSKPLDQIGVIAGAFGSAGAAQEVAIASAKCLIDAA